MALPRHACLAFSIVFVMHLQGSMGLPTFPSATPSGIPTGSMPTGQPLTPQPEAPAQPKPLITSPDALGISHTIQLHVIPCACPSLDEGTPGAACRRIVNQAFQPGYAQGICVIYHGIYAFTDMYGCVSFAKDHPGQQVDLAVVPFMYPVMRRGQVIDHWQYAAELPYRLYRATYQAPAPDAHRQNPQISASWTIELLNQPTIPDDAIIILADPHAIRVPLGTMQAPTTDHLILPSLCLTQPAITQESPVYALLKTLKYIRYVRPVWEPHKQSHASILSYAPYRLMA